MAGSGRTGRVVSSLFLEVGCSEPRPPPTESRTRPLRSEACRAESAGLARRSSAAPFRGRSPRRGPPARPLARRSASRAERCSRTVRTSPRPPRSRRSSRSYRADGLRPGPADWLRLRSLDCSRPRPVRADPRRPPLAPVVRPLRPAFPCEPRSPPVPRAGGLSPVPEPVRPEPVDLPALRPGEPGALLLPALLLPALLLAVRDPRPVPSVFLRCGRPLSGTGVPLRWWGGRA